MRPRIGLTLDEDDSGYRLQRAYVDVVVAAGGLPLPIACADPALAPGHLALCDALVVTGGDFDVPPARYGEVRRAACRRENPRRTEVEWVLCEAALRERLPVLGVCGGMQLVNVVRGGTLVQDLREDLGVVGHEQPPPRDVPSHLVEIAPGSLLDRLTGPGVLAVGSSHHQAVRAVGAGVRVSARAPDGVVEAIEVPEVPFALGVQWHPERLARDPRHLAIWRGLVAAAEELRTRR